MYSVTLLHIIQMHVLGLFFAAQMRHQKVNECIFFCESSREALARSPKTARNSRWKFPAKHQDFYRSSSHKVLNVSATLQACAGAPRGA
jgi:hypothetical protein